MSTAPLHTFPFLTHLFVQLLTTGNRILLGTPFGFLVVILTMCCSLDFDVRGGRHPVVEKYLCQFSRQFIKNNCNLSPSNRFSLITGPNMGGKSTFLRQNALISIMAQCGFFVPADSATTGLVDAIFTRIGASDDLTKDQSTFMCEMKEAANIINNATFKSLVIMDELGRGTSTNEGFAIAKAVSHHLYHANACRILFATHFHQIGSLFRSFPSCKLLMTTAVIDDARKSIIFLHKLVPGLSSTSYGIHVARLAGMLYVYKL